MSNGNQKLPHLKNYQKEAVEFIEKNFLNDINSLCAMGVGTGKTRVACEVIKNHIKSSDGYVLVCCPNVTLIQAPWAETLNNMGIKPRYLSDIEFEKNILERKKKFNHIPKKVYLITYKLLISESYGIENSVYFKNNPPSMIIFDEMHYLSNNPARKQVDSSDADEAEDKKKSRIAVSSIRAERRLGLTATPIVNRSDELKSAYELLNQGNNAGTEKFIFEKNIPYSGTIVKQFFIEIPFSKEEYETLDSLKFWLDGNILAESPLSQKLLVCKVCTVKNAKFTIKNHSSKNIVLKTILEHIPKTDKVLIFDEIRASLDYLSRRRWMEKYNPIVYHGGVGKSLQNKLYEQFLTNNEYRVFMTTRQIAGEGLNLQVANHIIMLSFGWTPKDIIQTAGRIKRLGQKKDVFIYIIKGDFSKYEALTLTAAPFSEQCHYEKICKKIKEINNNLENTYELGFLRTSEVFPDLFKKNESLREDTAKFIDSVQKNYIQKIEDVKKQKEEVNTMLKTIMVYKALYNKSTD